MKSLKILMTISVVFCFIGLYAQTNDFGVWANADISIKILPKLNATFEEELRTRDNSGTIDRFESSLELSYKFNKYLKAGGGYSLINYNHPDDYWETRHRYFFFIQGEYSLNRFTFSLKERYQSTYRVGVSETSTRANPKLYLRSRLMATYDIRKSRFSPYCSAEFYYTLNNPTENQMNKIRYTIGSKFKLNKSSNLNIYYRYVTKKNTSDIEGDNILGLGYSFNF